MKRGRLEFGIMKKISVVAAFVFAAFAAVAQTNLDFPADRPMPADDTRTNDPSARVLSLQDCIAGALKHNFDVQVERYNPQISLYGLNAAYAGYDPLFSLSGQHNYNKSGLDGFPPDVAKQNTFQSGLNGATPWGMTYDLSGSVSKSYGFSYPTNYSGSSGQIGVTVTQPLLKNFWIDDNRLLISAAKNNVKQSEQGLRQQFITTVAAVEVAYYELIYARENLKVQQEALQLAQTQLDQDKQRMQIGTLAQLSVQQDESQLAQNQASLITAEFTLESDQNTLKNLITDNYLQWHNADIAPSESLDATNQVFDLQASWNKGLMLRPDLLQAKLDVEQQGIQLKYDRNQIYPQLDLVGSYGFNGAGQDFNGTYDQFGQANRPFYSYGAQLSVPLSNAKARNSFKSDKATEQQLLLKLKQLEQNVMVQIDNAVKQAQSALQSVNATRQARVYAEAALDAEQKTYAVGKATTFEVLQYQNTLTTARSQEIRALANYKEALSNLAVQEGSTLERNGIDIAAK